MLINCQILKPSSILIYPCSKSYSYPSILFYAENRVHTDVASRILVRCFDLAAIILEFSRDICPFCNDQVCLVFVCTFIIDACLYRYVPDSVTINRYDAHYYEFMRIFDTFKVSAFSV